MNWTYRRFEVVRYNSELFTANVVGHLLGHSAYQAGARKPGVDSSVDGIDAQTRADGDPYLISARPETPHAHR